MGAMQVVRRGVMAKPTSRSYAAEVLADSPLAYYRLGEASGTSAADSSAVGSLGGTYVLAPTLGATGALPHDSNTAVTLNGTTQWVTLPSGARLASGATYTVEGWIKTVMTGDGNVYGEGSAGLGQIPLYFGVESGKLSSYTRPGGSFKHTSGVATVNDGVWHHVVMVRDAVPNILFYLDGVLDQSVAAGGTSSAGDAPLLGAGSRGTPEFQLAGSLDEVALYATALSATRITAHYAAR